MGLNNRPKHLIQRRERYNVSSSPGTFGFHVRERLVVIRNMIGWVRPRLNVEFGLQDGKLVLRGPDGRRFVSYVELVAQRQQSEAQAKREHQRAELQQQQRAERLADKLLAMGIDPDSV